MLFSACGATRPDSLYYDENLRRTDAQWYEANGFIRTSDFKLGTYFDSIRRRFEADDPNAVFGLAGTIRQLAPYADWFSNLSYLEGRAFQQLDLHEEAREKYRDFIHYSSRLLPMRHTGAFGIDPSDSLYLRQRHHASAFLDGYYVEPPVVLPPCPPRYVYQPNQPGFSKPRWRSVRMSHEQHFFLEHGPENLLGFGLRTGLVLTPKVSFSLELASGMQGAYASVRLGLPLQLYQAPNDRFGIKLTPFFDYTHFDSIEVRSTPVSMSGHYLDGGARLSVGWFVTPTLSLGAYGEYHVHNRRHPWISPQGIPFYTPNEVDVSLYYGVYEGLALKAGVKNEHLVLGLFLSGWELSYSLNKGVFVMSHSLD